MGRDPAVGRVVTHREGGPELVSRDGRSTYLVVSFKAGIEDTDHARNTEESYASLLELMHWLGLDWDEGPEVGGPFAPYRQS